MIKTVGRSSHRMSGWRASSALWLLSIAMFLRAFVPAGYMLDSNALSNGRIELSFCTAAGDISTISMSLPDSSSHHDPADAGGECPFALFNQVVTAMPQVGLLPALLVEQTTMVVFLDAYRALPALPAQGPPLGSRAPPSYLG